MDRNEVIECMARGLCARDCIAMHSYREACDGCSRWTRYTVEAEAALTALEAAGYVVVPKTLLAVRDALADGDVDEAYYQLRMMADPKPEVWQDHWSVWEAALAAAKE